MNFLDLADRVDASIASDFELERTIKAALEGREYISYQDDLAGHRGASPPRYLSSLDAAITLAGSEAVMVLLEAINNCQRNSVEEWVKALPRYVTAAALRVRHDR